MLEEVKNAINKEFKKMPRDKKIQLLNAYSFCYDHANFNTTLGDFYWKEIFLAKDPSITDLKSASVNRWYLRHSNREGRMTD